MEIISKILMTLWGIGAITFFLLAIFTKNKNENQYEDTKKFS